MDLLYNYDTKYLKGGGDLLFYGGFPNLVNNNDNTNSNTSNNDNSDTNSDTSDNDNSKKQEFIVQKKMPSFLNDKIKINEILQKRKEYIKPLINLSEVDTKSKKTYQIVSNIDLKDIL